MCSAAGRHHSPPAYEKQYNNSQRPGGAKRPRPLPPPRPSVLPCSLLLPLTLLWGRRGGPVLSAQFLPKQRHSSARKRGTPHPRDHVRTSVPAPRPQRPTMHETRQTQWAPAAPQCGSLHAVGSGQAVGYSCPQGHNAGAAPATKNPKKNWSKGWHVPACLGISVTVQNATHKTHPTGCAGTGRRHSTRRLWHWEGRQQQYGNNNQRFRKGSSSVPAAGQDGAYKCAG